MEDLKAQHEEQMEEQRHQFEQQLEAEREAMALKAGNLQVRILYRSKLQTRYKVFETIEKHLSSRSIQDERSHKY